MMRFMNFKTKLLLIKVINFVLIVTALAVSYAYYHAEYVKYIDKTIASKISLHKKRLAAPLAEAKAHFEKNTPVYKRIHQDAITQFKANNDIDLATLKTNLLQKYNLPNTEIDIFLINQDFKVFQTTYSQDVDLDLSVFPDTVTTLNNALSNDDIHISEFVSRDPLDMKYKMYSYARVSDDTILELAFMDSNSRVALFDAIHAFDDEFATTLFHVLKDGDKLFYFPVKEKNDSLSKEAFFSSLHRFTPNDPKRHTDHVIQTYLQKKRIVVENGNLYQVYASIFKPDNTPIKTEYQNIIVRFDLDIQKRNAFLSSLRTIFVLTALTSSLILFFLYQLIKRGMEQPIELITKRIQNGKKIPVDLLPNIHDEFCTIAKEYNKLHDKFADEVKKNENLLLIDHLTQIQNRKAFDIRTDELFHRYERYGTIFSVLLFDIDNFKKINDTLGHHTADKILIDLTELTQSVIRDCDFFYRVGGEEFIILFPETPLEDAFTAAETIRQRIESHFTDIRDGSVTISGGVCQVKPYDTKESLFKCADRLQYEAKERGKNIILTSAECQ